MSIFNKLRNWLYRKKRFVANLLNPNIDYLWTQKIRKLDAAKGLDFTRTEPLEMGITDENVFRNSPSGNKFLYNALKQLPITNNSCILDIGCGKGDAMRLMLRFPFKKIDGIEYSDKITAIARKNFEILGSTNKVTIFNCNAIDFDNYGEYDFFYLYNPFGGETMSKVLPKIKEQCKGKKSYIVYTYPVCANFFAENGLRKIMDLRFVENKRIFVYEF